MHNRMDFLSFSFHYHTDTVADEAYSNTICNTSCKGHENNRKECCLKIVFALFILNTWLSYVSYGLRLAFFII